ncbi:MAG: penicillin acylase family protein [Wenzhouxiangellaceae bacterium]|nr:MAG: penicillin acylase family protein [Wenzhouxiangellaceae bacterium]
MRWFVITGVAGALLLAVLSVAATWLVLGSRMEPSGRIELAGLGQPVTIEFDAFGRPAVAARSLNDAGFALGYLHASERLWQMDLLRRAGSARLAALLGADMLPTDKALWRAGVTDLAEHLEAVASDRLLALVEAYVAGINGGLSGLRRLPPEYLLLRSAVEPWTSADVFAIGALLAFDSDGNHELELLRLALAEALDEERLELFVMRQAEESDFPWLWRPQDTESGEEMPAEPAPSAHGALSTKGWREALAWLEDTRRRPTGAAIRLGSNGWVVAPERSASGYSLFAFDSHDPVSLPNLFYEVHLFYGRGRQLRGWSVPGFPLFINGFNLRLAWGFTNIGDSQDLVILRPDQTNPLRFFDGATWHEGRREGRKFSVRGEDPIEVDRVLTRHGPLISDDPPIALRWIAQELETEGMDALLEMNLASSAEDFMAAMARFPAPISNVTWGDIDGNIGFRTVGRLPRRLHGDGLTPLVDPGPQVWDGLVPAAEMPWTLNPASGFVAAANAAVHDQSWRWIVTHDHAPGYRIRRIASVLGAGGALSFDDMRVLQMDFYNEQAARQLPILLAVVDGSEVDAKTEAALGLLEKWLDRPYNRPESSAALVFESWYLALAETLFSDALGEHLYDQVMRQNYLVNRALDHLLKDQRSIWWEGNAQGKMVASLELAVQRLAEGLGPDPRQWRLGNLQEVRLEHALAGAVPGLGRVLSRGPYPSGGGHATVGRAGSRYSRPFAVYNAATVRTVIELSDPMRGGSVIPGGQSGHFASPHYNDQTSNWREGRLIEFPGVPDEGSGLILEPVP